MSCAHSCVFLLLEQGEPRTPQVFTSPTLVCARILCCWELKGCSISANLSDGKGLVLLGMLWYSGILANVNTYLCCGNGSRNRYPGLVGTRLSGMCYQQRGLPGFYYPMFKSLNFNQFHKGRYEIHPVTQLGTHQTLRTSSGVFLRACRRQQPCYSLKAGLVAPACRRRRSSEENRTGWMVGGILFQG